jgi:hypothetical protein
MIDLTLLAGTAITLASLCAWLNIKCNGQTGWPNAIVLNLSFFGLTAGLLTAFYTLFLMTVEVW